VPILVAARSYPVLVGDPLRVVYAGVMMASPVMVSLLVLSPPAPESDRAMPKSATSVEPYR
jgi:hypothetical protein